MLGCMLGCLGRMLHHRIHACPRVAQRCGGWRWSAPCAPGASCTPTLDAPVLRSRVDGPQPTGRVLVPPAARPAAWRQRAALNRGAAATPPWASWSARCGAAGSQILSTSLLWVSDRGWSRALCCAIQGNSALRPSACLPASNSYWWVRPEPVGCAGCSGAGQCGKDNRAVPPAPWRGSQNGAHHRQQRGGGGLEQHPLHHVGPGRSGVAQNLLEYILFKYRGTGTQRYIEINIV